LLKGMKEFPPSQKAGSFSLDLVMEKLDEGTAGNTRLDAVTSGK